MNKYGKVKELHWQRRTELLRKNLSQRHFVHHTSFMQSNSQFSELKWTVHITTPTATGHYHH